MQVVKLNDRGSTVYIRRRSPLGLVQLRSLEGDTVGRRATRKALPHISGYRAITLFSKLYEHFLKPTESKLALRMLYACVSRLCYEHNVCLSVCPSVMLVECDYRT